jgi:hypothetical protein
VYKSWEGMTLKNLVIHSSTDNRKLTTGDNLISIFQMGAFLQHLAAISHQWIWDVIEMRKKQFPEKLLHLSEDIATLNSRHCLSHLHYTYCNSS